jgi:hypothetical protein
VLHPRQGVDDSVMHKVQKMQNKAEKSICGCHLSVHDDGTDLRRRSDPAEASLSLRVFADSRLRDVGDAACPPRYPCPPLGEYGEVRKGPMCEDGERDVAEAGRCLD